LFVVNNCWAGIDFDGTDDQVNCGSAASLDNLVAQGGGGITVSAWVNTDSAGGDSYGCIVSKINWATNSGWIFSRGDGEGAGSLNSLEFTQPFSGTDLFRTTALNSFTNSVWHHVLVTYDGSTTAANAHIYIDGTEPSYSISQDATLTRSSDISENLLIGLTTTGDEFDGRISEVAIWNVVLTASQIALLASSRIKGMPLMIQPTALKGYWPMNEGVHGVSADLDTAWDLSGNANNGNPDNGANNTGLTWAAETVLNYPSPILQGQ